MLGRPTVLFAFVLLWGLGVYVADEPAGASFCSAVPPAEVQSSPTNHKRKPSIVYVNGRYGFKFYLPKSWKGYSVLLNQWNGGVPGEEEDASGNGRIEFGPQLTIRNHKWTEANPWQDVPIMIFTLDQWKLVEQGKLVISAAPVGPGEIGRSCRYVFALPPRYNVADAIGKEEVMDIMNSDPLVAF